MLPRRGSRAGRDSRLTRCDWALLLAMLAAVVGAITGAIAGALLLAVLGAAVGWGLRTFLGPSTAGRSSRSGILLAGIVGSCAGAAIGALVGAGDATRSANGALNWAIPGIRRDGRLGTSHALVRVIGLRSG